MLKMPEDTEESMELLESREAHARWSAPKKAACWVISIIAVVGIAIGLSLIH